MYHRLTISPARYVLSASSFISNDVFLFNNPRHNYSKISYVRIDARRVGSEVRVLGVRYKIVESKIILPQIYRTYHTPRDVLANVKRCLPRYLTGNPCCALK